VARAGRMQPLDRARGFLIAAEAQCVAGPALPDYGIAFCAMAAPPATTINSYYCFQINDNQTFALWLWNVNWTCLISTTQSPLIRPGQPNRLAVLVRQRKLIFFINDQYVTDIEAAELPGGTAGVLMELQKAGDSAQVHFYRVEVRTP
jgi:hypothetical protein